MTTFSISILFDDPYIHPNLISHLDMTQSRNFDSVTNVYQKLFEIIQ